MLGFGLGSELWLGLVLCYGHGKFRVRVGFGAIQMLRNADGGGGGCLIFWKKALRRCNVQCY